MSAASHDMKKLLKRVDVYEGKKVLKMSCLAKSHEHFNCLNSELRNRKNDLILIMTSEKQDKTSELSKHWSPDSTPARMK